MSTRHSLPSEGCWVELKDFTDLRYGDKQSIQAAIDNPQRTMQAGVELVNALYALLIVSWQLPSPLPVPAQDPSVVAMLSIADGNALEEMIKPAQELLFPGTAEPETPEALAEAVADPASPTVPTVD